VTGYATNAPDKKNLARLLCVRYISWLRLIVKDDTFVIARGLKTLYSVRNMLNILRIFKFISLWRGPMFTIKSISRAFSVLMIVMFLLTGVLPAQAKSLARPLYAANSDFIWAKSMGGASYDYGKGIAVDSSGNVYTTGYFRDTADFDPGVSTFNLTSAGGDDIFVAKLAGNGNFVWAKCIGGTNGDYGTGITVDSSGNVYTTGYFYGTVDFDPGASISNLTSAGGYDIFVSKLDSSGNFVWAKNMGGIDYDYGNGIAVDSNGNVYTTGSFVLTADFDPGASISNLTSAGGYDIFVSKLNNSGNFVWAKNMGGTNNDYGTGYKDEGYSIAVDSSFNVYTTGIFYDTADFDPDNVGATTLTSAGSHDIFVSKLDSSGNFVWAKSMGGVYDDRGYSIAVDSSRNAVYTTGEFVLTADFDPDAGTANLTSAGVGDIFVSKLDSSGNFVWAKNMGGIVYDYGYGIALDSSGNVYTTGLFGETADFDPDSVNTSNLTSVGGSDVFVSKLDNSGNFVWAKRMGGTDYDHGSGIAVDSNGSVYTTGDFLVAADFGAGPLTSAGVTDIFVSKLGIDVVAPTVTSIVRASSNPTTAANVNFTVTFSEPVSGVAAGDFTLTTTGSIARASVSGVGGGPIAYTVTVNTGTGNGTIRLDVPVSATIADLVGHPLASLPYVSGEFYTINKIITPTQTSTPSRTPTKTPAVIIFRSAGAYDGWVLESGEKTNKGSTLDAKTTTFRIGDDKSKKQYRGILSFSTGSLPDNAVITGVTLKVRQQVIVGGGNPVSAFGGFVADIKNGFFGTASALQTGDFQAAASKSYGPFNTALVGGWYSINLNGAKGYVNKLSANSGLTQIRLRFNLDDNNNAIANYLSLYSGNTTTAANRPQLVITYIVP
jgi:hypothetical protein